MSRVVTWGLIGAGDIVRKRVAAALRDAPGSRLLAVSRARSELAAAFAASIGAPRSYPRWEQLVADREIDAVYIATPVRIHAEQAIAAADAGKHVLCEKPMALSVAECDRILAACRANGVRLGVAYYRRFYPVVRRIKQAIASGEIGEPVVAHFDVFEPFNPSPDSPRAWFLKKSEAGGGPMMDFGCHRLEVLFNLFGAPTGVTSIVSHAVLKREVEDTAIALLQFERGLCATVTVTHAAMEPRDAFHLFGTRGSIHVDALSSGDLCLRLGDGVHRESHPPAANLHQPLVDAFVRAVLAGRDPEVNGIVGRAIAAIEEQIYAPRA